MKKSKKSSKFSSMFCIFTLEAIKIINQSSKLLLIFLLPIHRSVYGLIVSALMTRMCSLCNCRLLFSFTFLSLCFYFSRLIPSNSACLVTAHAILHLDSVQLHLSSVLNLQKLLFSSALCLWCLNIPRPCTISIPHSPLSHCIRPLSIPCGWPPSREAHFLILELPEPQRVTGPGQPTRGRQTQPPSCLQEVDNKAFVFSFYKRKFCRRLPGRSDEADTQTHT